MRYKEIMFKKFRLLVELRKIGKYYLYLLI